MKSRALLSVFVLILALSACNLPSNAPTETPTLSAITPSATQSPSTETPTQTAQPSNTPPPTTTTTPTVPVAFPREVAVNCRLGPSVAWIVLSGLNVGASAQIVGKTADGGWWYIVDPFSSSRNCWVASSVTNTAGNLAGIPVVAAPNATVTDVSVDVDPNTINVPGCVGPILPIEIGGTIETNGPVTVTWHFETEQGGALPTQNTEFDAFGSENFSVDYTPPLTAGTYWVRLIVTSPNSIQAEEEYTITCP
ncbi:MAG: hypothetical protein EHM33_24750 [Chloroflexi bacterium]|nr:MAG: hypothetical protein EHM33_24750 [Chloroflexota bacterium]